MKRKQVFGAVLTLGVLVGLILVAINRSPFEVSRQQRWISMGPSPLNVSSQHPWSGRVTSLVLAGSSVYVGSAGGGVWTMKQGEHFWTPLTDNQPTLAIGSLAVDPLNSTTIYAGTGEADYYDAQSGNGILKTTNGGKTWSLLGKNVFNGQSVVGVAVSPTNDRLIYAATDKGVYKSQNAGVTWRQLLQNKTPSTVCDVEVSTARPETVYAAVPGVGIEKSTDEGSSWKLLSGGLPTSKLFGAKVSISSSSLNVVYAAVATTTNAFEFFASNDGGTSWTRHNVSAKGQLSALSFSEEALTVDPHNPNHVFLGDRQLYESVDGGRTWTIPPYTHADYHAIVFGSEGNVYIGNDGGVFMLSAHNTVSDLNYNLDITQFYPGLSQYDNGKIILGGTQDNGAVLSSNPHHWQFVLDEDNGYSAINPQNPQDIYSVWLMPLRVFKSDNQGRTWTDITPSELKSSNFRKPSGVYPLALDPSNPNVLLFGADKVYRTVNGGSTWTAISPTLAPFSYGNKITALAISKVNSQIIYVGNAQGQVFVTTDGGTHWVQQQLPPSSPSWVSVSSIAIDPSNPYDVYVSFGGFSDVTFHTRVLHSPDSRGKSFMWVDVTGNLPLSPVDTVARSGNLVYAGTNQGVFRSYVGDSQWTKVGVGLPDALVTSIIHTGNGTLIVGTHGRGVWELEAQ